MSLFIYFCWEKNWVNGGDLSWHLPLERDHNDTLFAGPGLAEARDPNKP